MVGLVVVEVVVVFLVAVVGVRAAKMEKSIKEYLTIRYLRSTICSLKGVSRAII